MKAKYLIIIPLLMLYSEIFSQDIRSDVKTPIGSNVKAYETEEASDYTRAYYDNYFSTAYPNATPIITSGSYSSSRRFNCHGYAWYMMSLEGGNNLGDPRWIGYNETTAEDIYMTDGSYKEVASEVYPGKVSWASGDHSAITTSTSGVYLSKWNQYPLMEHEWDDSPFGTSNLKYYKLCYEKIVDVTITTNLIKDACKLFIENVVIQNNVDVDIEFEDWVKIEGPFEITSGSTLIISPY